MDENLLFNANELLQYKYITVPKELFVNPKYSRLSSDSKLLYGFILDRFSLSLKIIGKMKKEKPILFLQEKIFKNCLTYQIKQLQKHLKNYLLVNLYMRKSKEEINLI